MKERIKLKFLRVLQRLDRVSREDVNEYYEKILGRLPESEKPFEDHVGHTDFRTWVHALLDSEEFRSRVESGKVSRQDVDDAFMKVLGRVPGSEEFFQATVGKTDYRGLVEGLLDSEEFRIRVTPKIVPTGRVFHRLAAAHNEVDTDSSAGQLQLCLARVQAQWRSLGESRPHFSVLTDERFEPEQLPQNIGVFRKSGYREVDQLLAIMKRYGVGDLRSAQANELGCGVGRVTIPMARHFGRVTGYDISPPHLELARAYADECGMKNISFREVPVGTLPTFEPCDLFYSRIVLQHNPPPVIRHLVRAILGALRPGGLAFFQVPSYIVGYRFSLEDWLNAPPIDNMEMHALPVRHVLEEASAQDCVPLEVWEDNAGSNLVRSQTYLMQKRGTPGLR